MIWTREYIFNTSQSRTVLCRLCQNVYRMWVEICVHVILTGSESEATGRVEHIVYLLESRNQERGLYTIQSTKQYSETERQETRHCRL